MATSGTTRTAGTARIARVRVQARDSGELPEIATDEVVGKRQQGRKDVERQQPFDGPAAEGGASDLEVAEQPSEHGSADERGRECEERDQGADIGRGEVGRPWAYERP